MSIAVPRFVGIDFGVVMFQRYDYFSSKVSSGRSFQT